MKIAIVGAGLAGLSSCFHLSQHTPYSIDLFYDPNAIHGASSAAVGLLHPYPGPFMKSYTYYRHLIKCSINQVQQLERTYNQSLIINHTIYRPHVWTIQNSKNKIIRRNPLLKIIENYPPIKPLSWINRSSFELDIGYTIDTPLYLKLLLQFAKDNQIKLQNEQVTDLLSLEKQYDIVVWCIGDRFNKVLNMPHLPLTLIKGQALHLNMPSMDQSISIAGKGYFCPTGDPSIWCLGATYEKEYTSSAPDPVVAIESLKNKASLYLNLNFTNADITNIKSGVRAFLPTKRPAIAQITKKSFVYCGLGSKGLLYHAYLGKQIPKLISNSFL